MLATVALEARGSRYQSEPLSTIVAVRHNYEAGQRSMENRSLMGGLPTNSANALILSAQASAEKRSLAS